MDLRRLTLLRELERRGSMRSVAEALGYTTSTVSQQLSVLSREVGVALLEPDGRRVRLTPAGRRLAAHAQTILAAVETARSDLDPTSAPAGTVRVAGFATAMRRVLVPLAGRLGREHPDVRLSLREHEPAEALALLRDDAVDLALVYDYDLAPLELDSALVGTALWRTRWGLGIPAVEGVWPRDDDAAAVVARFADAAWIVNSRNRADEDVVRTIASIAGFEPQVVHRADSLGLVGDMIVAGLGVGLLPVDAPVAAGVRVLDLTRPAVTLRAYAAVRGGRGSWAPLALVRRMLQRGSAEPDA